MKHDVYTIILSIYLVVLTCIKKVKKDECILIQNFFFYSQSMKMLITFLDSYQLQCIFSDSTC